MSANIVSPAPRFPRAAWPFPRLNGSCRASSASFETALGKLGLKKEKINIRMTGCPNGCARPYQSEVGIVGRSGDKYCIFIGGSLLGTSSCTIWPRGPGPENKIEALASRLPPMKMQYLSPERPTMPTSLW